MEARLRLARLALPGSSLSLLPLVVLALIEPVSIRLGTARWSWPTLGPVPPPARGPIVPRAPIRSSLVDPARR